MSVTNNLKKQVDLPVFEWARPLPAATSAVSAFTTANSLGARYIYYVVSSSFYRYDTITDSWHQLASPLVTPATLVEMGYSSALGHYGRAIGSGGANNTIELAGLCGNSLVGYKIRILSGTGAGQERTITAVSAPIIKDRGVVTNGSNQAVIDSSSGSLLKQWKINSYRDHQVRLDYGAGVTQVRPILNNNYNTLSVYDANYASVTPWWGPYMPAATAAGGGVNTLYQIESNVITVNSNWDVNPDSTSNFVILSGGIWLITSQTASPYYNIQYYDVIADMWYRKSAQSGLLTGALATDVTFERFTEAGGALLSSTATSGAARSLTNSLAAMEVGRYNNFEIRITGGTAKGQVRTILFNTATTFYVTRDWDTNNSGSVIAPDNTSTYEIYRDCGKLLISGNGASALYQYDLESDQMTPSKQYDYGTVRQMSYYTPGNEPLAISSITRSSGGITSLSPTPTAGGSGYLVDQILTITTGGSLGTARITSVDTAGAVLSVSLETAGNTYTTGTGKATTVSPVGGTGCTLNILTVGEVAVVNTPISHNVKLGDTIVVAGANQSEYNGVKTVLGANAVTGFTYAITGTPINATYTSPSTTSIIDVSKSWAVNEHVGKLVQFTVSTGPDSLGVIRRISANTANTLSWVSAATAPTNGTSRYTIIDTKPLTTEMSVGAKLGNGRSGIATSGSSTTLVDTTKNWPVNYWSNTLPSGASNTPRKVKIIAGTGAGNEFAITSNTANTLYFATQAFSVDATSVYQILDCFGTATGGSVTTLVDTTQNWGTNSLVGKRVKFVGGTGQGQELTITANTQTTLTFTTATAPDTTTQYAILELNTRGAGIHMDAVTSSTNNSINNRYLYMWRGSGTPELSKYNIMTEQAELFTYFPVTETLSTGSMFVYDGQDRIYFTKDATGRIMYYDVTTNMVSPSGTIPYSMSTAIIGNRMEIIETEDGLKYMYIPRHSSQEFWRTLLFW